MTISVTTSACDCYFEMPDDLRAGDIVHLECGCGLQLEAPAPAE